MNTYKLCAFNIEINDADDFIMEIASDPKFTQSLNLDWPGGCAPVDPRNAVEDGFSRRCAERHEAMAKDDDLSQVVAFRIDIDKKALLEAVADAHGLKPGTFARTVVLEAIGSAAVTPRVTRRIMHGEELRALLGELARQGSNLNQLARHLNSGGRAADLPGFIEQLRAEHTAALRAVTRFIVGAEQ